MANPNKQSIKQQALLSPNALKKVANYSEFEFETTEQVPKLTNIVGQQRGRAVMNFGLNVRKPGFHIYVSGLEGTGKTSFAHSIVNDFADRETNLFDWCYVNNFEDGHKPKVLKLPVGLGKSLKKSMKILVNDLKMDIPSAFSDDNYQKDRTSTIRKFKEKGEQLFKETHKTASDYGFVIKQSGSSILTIPVEANGQPINEETYRVMDEKRVKKIEDDSAILQGIIMSSTKTLHHLEKELKKTLMELDHQIALTALDYHIDELKRIYKDCPTIINYLKAVKKDLLTNFHAFLSNEPKQEDNPLGVLFNGDDHVYKKYFVNLLVDNSGTKGAPVITADNSTFYNLIGKVEYENRMGVISTDFTKIKPGYLHYANGGYIIIQAKDIFSKSLAWEGLKRALLNYRLQIENIGEHSSLMATASLNPNPIPLDVALPRPNNNYIIVVHLFSS